MSELETRDLGSLTDRLAAESYWVARAARKLQQNKHSEVVQICREHLEEEPDLVSARLVYAKALFFSGQIESTAEEFRRVLSLDPDNLVALKYLGDICYASGDPAAALANYGRVLQIDPACRGLRSQITKERAVSTRTVTLTRSSEGQPERHSQARRDIPFFTETMGDLYLEQGYPRLAAEVFRRLGERGESPRIAEKLSRAEGKIKEKER